MLHGAPRVPRLVRRPAALTDEWLQRGAAQGTRASTHPPLRARAPTAPSAPSAPSAHKRRNPWVGMQPTLGGGEGRHLMSLRWRHDLVKGFHITYCLMHILFAT